MAGTTVPVPTVREHRAGPSALLSLATTIVALATLGALVPAAVESWASGGPAALQPVAVSLDGSLSTAGLPASPALSELTLRNTGPSAVLWTLETTVVGAARSAVTVEAWVAVGSGCDVRGVLLQPGRWSTTTLEPGADLPLCVRISDDGTATGSARPRVSVHARNG